MSVGTSKDGMRLEFHSEAFSRYFRTLTKRESLSASQRMVLLAVADTMWNGDGQFKIKTTELISRTGLSKRTITATLQQLAELKEIEITKNYSDEDRSQQANTYFIPDMRFIQKATSMVQDDPHADIAPPRADIARGPRENCAPNIGLGISNNPPLTPQATEGEEPTIGDSSFSENNNDKPQRAVSDDKRNSNYRKPRNKQEANKHKADGARAILEARLRDAQSEIERQSSEALREGRFQSSPTCEAIPNYI